MSRLTMLTTDTMTERQRAVQEAITSGPRGQVHGRSTGLLGPFNAWMRNPELADRAQGLGALLRFATQLPPRLTELAIIMVGRHMKAAFEFAAHAPLALQAGLAAEVIEAIRTGAPPQFAQQDERVVHALAAELLATHRVSAATYDAALALFGEVALVELVAVVGYYSLVSLTLNAFEVPLREGMADPFS